MAPDTRGSQPPGVIVPDHDEDVDARHKPSPGTGFYFELAEGPNGDLVFADDAVSSVAYLCPSCHMQVVRRPRNRRVSFYHAFDPTGRCSRDKVRLLTAQQLLARQLQYSITGGGNKLILVRRCPGLNIHLGCDRPVDYELESFDEVRICADADTELPDGLSLCRGGRLVALIHISVRFNRSARDRASGDLPYIELRAEDVLACADRCLPVSDGFEPVYCEACTDAERSYTERYRDGYLVDKKRCYKCKKDTPIFMWTGESWNEIAPPDPRPATVCWSYGETVQHSYWANTCEHCGALQGDFFLHSEPDSPFFGIMSVVPPRDVRRLDVKGWTDRERKSHLEKFLASSNTSRVAYPS